MFQKTTKEIVSVTGIGAHSGKEVTISLLPAPENHGIIFKRTDLPSDQNTIPALWSYVTDTLFCTTISNNYSASVGTIEHLMAALAAKQIDNLLIHINGAEVPILDGSAKPFFEILEKTGIQIQKAARRYLKVLKTVSVNHREAWAEIKENQSFSVDYIFRNKGTGESEVYYSGNVLDAFSNELSSARTFGFLEDVEKLYAAGLAKGSSLENALVFDQGKVLNPEGLRFPNECARHKALDAIGDLYLCGMPILGAFKGHCSGHTLNSMLLKKLLNDKSAWTIDVKPSPEKTTSSYIGRPHSSKTASSYPQTIRFGTY